MYYVNEFNILTYPKKERKKILQKVEKGIGGAVFLQRKWVELETEIIM